MSKPKKKFSETRVGQFLKMAGSKIGDVVGDLIPGSGILDTVASLINKDTELSPEQKEIALRHLELDQAELKEITARWEADMKSDNVLSKNVRPAVLAYLTVVTSALIMMDSSLETFVVDDVWVDLLKTLLVTVYLAYFGSRGYEKAKALQK